MQRLFILFLFVPFFSFGQNLVPNPSFEDTIACPIGVSDIDYAPPWFQPTQGTPDLFNACVPPIIIGNLCLGSGVPKNFPGYQFAKTGQGYAGGYSGPNANNYREYICAPLLDTLIAGKTYYTEAHVSLANCDPWDTIGTDGFGILFTIGKPDTAGVGTGVLPYTPQVANPAGNILSDTLVWMKISGTFVAVGGETHITFGNFRNDANTQGAGAYHYRDDFLLMEDTAEGVKEIYSNYEITIHPNPTTGTFTVQGTATEIQVYDLFGRLVLRTSKQQIDMSHQPKGVYVVKYGEAVRKLILR